MKDVQILKFSATWCGPCRRYAPIFNEFIEESGYKSQSFDVDLDHEIAAQYGVQSVPTTVFLVDGKVAQTETGAISKPGLRKIVESLTV